MKTIDFIVLNWKDESSTLECLEAISKLHGDYEKHLIVVDNESSPASRQTLESYGHPITLVNNPRNLGFAGGANSALSYLKGDFVAFINNDCVLDPGWLKAGLTAMEDEKIGAVGGKQFDWNDANPAFNQNNHVTPLPIIDPETAAVNHHLKADAERSDLVFVTASNLLIRASLLQSLGGFDPIFFAYYEDVDLCARIIDHGYLVAFSPKMMAWHQGNKTTNRIPYAKAYFSRRNPNIVIAKHFEGHWLARTIRSIAIEFVVNLLYWLRPSSSRNDRITARAVMAGDIWVILHAVKLIQMRRAYRQGLRRAPKYYQKLVNFYEKNTPNKPG